MCGCKRKLVRLLKTGPTSECTALAGAGAPVAGEQAERAFERLMQCALAALQHNPEGFKPWLAPWLRLVLDAALLAVDAPAVRAGRTKRRVALVRLSRCATCATVAMLPVHACRVFMRALLAVFPSPAAHRRFAQDIYHALPGSPFLSHSAL